MFRNSHIVGEVGDVFLPECKNIERFFSYCPITSVRSFIAPKAEQCRYVFGLCDQLHTVGTINFPMVKNIEGGFKGTENLKKIMVPGFNTSGYDFYALNAFKESGLSSTFGIKMEKWKAVSSLFALMVAA